MRSANQVVETLKATFAAFMTAMAGWHLFELMKWLATRGGNRRDQRRWPEGPA